MTRRLQSLHALLPLGSFFVHGFVVGLMGRSIAYKDIDTRWRWHLWRACAWSLATAADYGLAFHHSPLDSLLLNGLCWILAAGPNLLIVWSAIEIRRSIEIKPDCLILDGRAVFWREHRRQLARAEAAGRSKRPSSSAASTARALSSSASSAVSTTTTVRPRLLGAFRKHGGERCLQV